VLTGGQNFLHDEKVAKLQVDKLFETLIENGDSTKLGFGERARV
jgi:hypothetical protein